MNSSAAIRRFSGLGEAVRRHAEALRVVGLAVAALSLYLFELGKGALPDWDEAIYAEVSKEMLEGHHWLTPYWNHHPFFEKPPLLYWVQMAEFRLLGVTGFAARLESALAGVAIVLLVYAMTRRAAGPAAGLFAGFVLLTMHEFDRFMRVGITDALLVLFLYLMVYGYVRLREGDGRWFYLMCAALGLGILDKGPAVVVAPVAIGLDWFFRRREKKLITGRQFWLGMLLLAVLVLPWHLWMVAEFGWRFLDGYVGYHIVDRAFQRLNGSDGGPLYYIRGVGVGAFPWWILGVWAAVKWVWRREWKYSLLWALMGVTLLLYTLVATKYQHYVLPLYPALAMEVGRLLAEWSRKRRVIGYGAAAVILIGFGAAYRRLVIWPGTHFANVERSLALAAKASGDAGPLFVVGKPGPTDLDMRTVLFYSDRQVVWQQLPDKVHKLEAAVQEHPAVEVVMEKGTAALLARQMVVRPMAEVDEAELARVSRKP